MSTYATPDLESDDAATEQHTEPNTPAYVAEPDDVAPTETDEGLPPAQLERLSRALTECLLVNTLTPETAETGLAHVYSESGTQRVVDVETGACTCEDYQYNRPDGDDEFRCKHAYRVEVETSRRAIPEWVDRDALDDYLLDREDDVLVADGGRPQMTFSGAWNANQSRLSPMDGDNAGIDGSDDDGRPTVSARRDRGPTSFPAGRAGETTTGRRPPTLTTRRARTDVRIQALR